MPDRLYLLRPGFMDGGAGPFYCGECSLVEGMLSLFPDLRERLEVTYVDFERPRPAIVSVLGEDHQSAPVLVLEDPEATLPQGVKAKEADGHRFVDEPNQICVYLAARHGTPVMHHPV